MGAGPGAARHQRRVRRRGRLGGAHPSFTVDQARACGELVERLRDNGRQRELIVIAPHGGDIECHTDEQAEQVASRLVAKAGSSWRCKGWKGGAGALVRWHFTSTDVSAPSFPRLDPVISRGFTHAVAFHGFEDPEIDTDVINGGCAPEELKVGGSPPRSTRHGRFGPARGIAEPEDNLGGDDERNLANRLTAEGGAASRSSRVLESRHGRRGRARYRSLAVGRLREACLGSLGTSTRDEPVHLSDSRP